MFSQSIIQRLSKSDRRESSCFQEGLHRFILGEHAPVCCAIFFRKFCKLGTRAVNIPPLRQITAVRKRHMEDRIGLNVLQPVVSQLEFVFAYKRIIKQCSVRGRASIVMEAFQRQLSCFDATPKDWTALEHDASESGFG